MATSLGLHRAWSSVQHLAAALSVVAACRTSPGRPLREVTAPAGTQVRESLPHPFSQISPGVFSRTIYRSAPSAGLAVEVHDFEIAPKRTGSLSVEGPAVLGVRAGSGSLTVGQQRRDITPGLVLSIPQGASVQVANSADQPVTIRVYVVTAR
jgi:hypothetical protein